jgi:hypothetical protein
LIARHAQNKITDVARSTAESITDETTERDFEITAAAIFNINKACEKKRFSPYIRISY